MGLKEFLGKIKDKSEQRSFMSKYKKKLEALGFNEELIAVLMERRNDTEEQAILALAEQSSSQEDFAQKVVSRLQKQKGNIYAGCLLIGNLTGKYAFMDFTYGDPRHYLKDTERESGQGQNLFTKDNQDLLQILREHFPDYILNNNRRKNDFARTTAAGERRVRDLSVDTSREKLLEEFDKMISGQEVENDMFKKREFAEYLLRVLGTYSREDIEERFDFILYDIERDQSESLEQRREKYLRQASLTDDQKDRVAKVSILVQRLRKIGTKEAKELFDRVQRIKDDLVGNIEELDDIYFEYEMLYRQDLIDHLYVPQEDVTIVENYQDVRPQLVHQFIRSMEKFRASLEEDIKKKIIADRQNKDDSQELTPEEKERFRNMLMKLEAEIDPYKVNYTAESPDMIYSDQMGLSYYKSETSNQISGSILTGKDFLFANQNRILGIGFNRETLLPEAIAISSNQYKTTNKGINSIEDTEGREFEETSAPFEELAEARKTEVVMHRRGEDFDTKASYILVIIDSSNEKESKRVIEEAREMGQREGLKVVIYDTYKITQSYEQALQQMRGSKEQDER